MIKKPEELGGGAPGTKIPLSAAEAIELERSCQELLTRALIRVSLYVDGQDSSLDSLLRLLRESIQNPSHTGMNTVIARFDEAEPHIKQRREEGIVAFRQALLEIVQQLQQFSLPRVLRKTINQFLAELPQASKKIYLHSQLLQQLADIQLQAMNEVKQAKPSLWGKLSGISENDATKIMHQRLSKCVDNIELALASSSNLVQLKSQMQSAVDRVHQVLEGYAPDEVAHIENKYQPSITEKQRYDERLHYEYHRWKRYRRPLTIAVLAVDNFHRINDDYGREAAEKILQVIAISIARRLREVDFFCRLDGDKFVALLPETNLEGAKIVLNKIRLAIARASFNYQGQSIAATLSIGTTEFQGDDDSDVAFSRAEHFLNTAKLAGVNSVHFE